MQWRLHAWIRSTAAGRWPPFAVFCQPFLRCRNMLVHSQCSWGHTAHVCGRHSKQTGTLQCYQRSSLSCKALWLRFSVTQEFFIKSVCLTHQQIAALSGLQITRARKTILVKHSRGRWMMHWKMINYSLGFFVFVFLKAFCFLCN